MDLVRLGISRRVYAQSHANYIVQTLAEIAAAFERLKGHRIVLRRGQRCVISLRGSKPSGPELASRLRSARPTEL
jgi:hypothetical protein